MKHPPKEIATDHLQEHHMNTTAQNLDTLSATIREHIGQADEYTSKAQEHCMQAGKLLIEAKARIVAGEYVGGFDKWLKAECKVGRSRAYELLAIAKGTTTLEAIRESKATSMRKVRAKAPLAAVHHVVDTPAAPVLRIHHVVDAPAAPMDAERPRLIGLTDPERTRLIGLIESEIATAPLIDLRSILMHLLEKNHGRKIDAQAQAKLRAQGKSRAQASGNVLQFPKKA